jgi:transcriptional regulator GlxA family with amidase domain
LTCQNRPRFGVVIFPEFALLDVAGPLQLFNQLSSVRSYRLLIIAKTIDPVSTIPPEQNRRHDSYQPIGEQWLPTHTFDESPELDILLIPAGLGLYDETIFNDVAAFIKMQYPKLKYLLSVCTGSTVIAATGILDGRKATSNKYVWSLPMQHRTVNWISKARWIVDGNIWSSSGVAAGMDMTYAFISTTVSPEIAKHLSNAMEYAPRKDPEWDPFSTICHVSSE